MLEKSNIEVKNISAPEPQKVKTSAQPKIKKEEQIEEESSLMDEVTDITIKQVMEP